MDVTIINRIDLLLLLLVAFGFYSGYKKGLILSFFSAAALFGAFVITFFFADKFLEILHTYNPKLTLSYGVVATLVLFGASFAGILYLGHLLRKVVQWSLFAGILDQVAGGMVSAYIWFSFFGIGILFICNYVSFPLQSYTCTCMLFKVIQSNTVFLLDFLLKLWPEFKQFFQDFDILMQS